MKEKLNIKMLKRNEFLELMQTNVHIHAFSTFLKLRK